MKNINGVIVTASVLVQTLVARLRERAARAESGQGLVEYALILAFVAVAIVVAFKLLQPAITDTFNRVTDTLNGSSTPVPMGTPTP